MLNIAVAAADAVRQKCEFDPWRGVGVEAGPIFADLKSCLEKGLLQMKTVNDKRER